MLLQTTIDDLRAGKITIISKEIKRPTYYNYNGRKLKEIKYLTHYALCEDGETYLVSKKILKMYEEVLHNNIDKSII